MDDIFQASACKVMSLNDLQISRTVKTVAVHTDRLYLLAPFDWPT